jgi:VWFA-related protein
MDTNGHDNMGRMKPRTVVVLLVLIMTVGGFARSSPQSGQDTLKVTVDLVNVQFSVTDRHGRFVPGLTAQDFKVEEDGRRQEIRNFARENELPLTLALLVDTSPSVRPVFDEEKTTAQAFLESILRTKDLALIMGFDRSVTLVQDYTDDVKQLKRAIGELEIGGGTSVYDAVYLACKEKRRRRHDEQSQIQRIARRRASE